MSGNATFCDGPGWVMGNGFTSAPSFCPIYLFEGWVVNTATKYAFAFLGTVAMGIFNELFKLFRKRLEMDIHNKVG